MLKVCVYQLRKESKISGNVLATCGKRAPFKNQSIPYFRHADTCDFRHSRNRVNVGENIWAAPYSNYSDAISIWFNEVREGGFEPGSCWY